MVDAGVRALHPRPDTRTAKCRMGLKHDITSVLKAEFAA